MVDHDEDDWPDHAIPVTDSDMGVAVATLRRRDPWTRAFTLAALSDAVEPLFTAGWCPAALRRALIIQPKTNKPYDTPAIRTEDILERWKAWNVPPVLGREIGISLVAQFGRDTTQEIRDSWSAKAIPQNPVQVFRATKWMRLSFGWSTRATLMELVTLLTPWFARRWCPEAIRWAVEHQPGGTGYPVLPATLDEITKRLTRWERSGKRDTPPIVGAPWAAIVQVRQERLVRDRSNDEVLQRWSQRQIDRYEYWLYKRSAPGKREQDDRVEASLRSLVPTPVRMTGPDPQMPITDDKLCQCQKYWCLPGQPWCVACSRRYTPVSVAPGGRPRRR